MHVYLRIMVLFAHCWVNSLLGEYLYPLCVYSDHDNECQMIVLYQKSVHETELWQWNPYTKIAEKLTSSRYNPAGITLLPNHQGFSFIDEGRIRLKKFFKRSPKSIDIGMPLYSLGVVHWITEQSGYCSAKFGNHYGIYQIDEAGNAVCLVRSDTADCLYPIKVGSWLYYIERSLLEDDGIYRYTVLRTPYLPYALHESEFFELEFDWLVRPKQVLCDCQQQAAIFLSMLHEDEGFYVEYPGTIKKDTPEITFTCYRLQVRNEHWQKIRLFDFTLPASLIIHADDTCLYESLLPLMPCYDQGIFYFVDTQRSPDCQKLALYSYSIKTGESALRAGGTAHSFAPRRVADTFFYGSDSPRIVTDDEGITTMELDFFSA